MKLIVKIKEIENVDDLKLILQTLKEYDKNLNPIRDVKLTKDKDFGDSLIIDIDFNKLIEHSNLSASSLKTEISEQEQRYLIDDYLVELNKILTGNISLDVNNRKVMETKEKGQNVSKNLYHVIEGFKRLVKEGKMKSQEDIDTNLLKEQILSLNIKDSDLEEIKGGDELEFSNFRIYTGATIEEMREALLSVLIEQNKKIINQIRDQEINPNVSLEGLLNINITSKKADGPSTVEPHADGFLVKPRGATIGRIEITNDLSNIIDYLITFKSNKKEFAKWFIDKNTEVLTQEDMAIVYKENLNALIAKVDKELDIYNLIEEYKLEKIPKDSEFIQSKK